MNDEPESIGLRMPAHPNNHQLKQNIRKLTKKKGKVYRNWRNQLFPCADCTNEGLECGTCDDKSNWVPLT